MVVLVIFREKDWLLKYIDCYHYTAIYPKTDAEKWMKFKMHL